MADRWQRLADEPLVSFARFLHFRNLGPGRTVALAYANYRKTAGKPPAGTAPKSTQKHPISGQWKTDSVRWQWVGRAEEYDIHVFEEHGRTACVRFIGALDLISARVCEKLAEAVIQPTVWSDLLDAVAIIQAYAVPETIDEIRARWLDSAQGRAAEDRPGTGDRPGPADDLR